MESCVLLAGRKAKGEKYFPKLELVRFTIPRRVYTQAHMDVIAESLARVFESRNKIKGMKMVYVPKYLRFFQARFEKLKTLSQTDRLSHYLPVHTNHSIFCHYTFFQRGLLQPYNHCV